MIGQDRQRFDLRLILVLTIILLQVVLSTSIFHYWSQSTCKVKTSTTASVSGCGSSLEDVATRKCTLDVLASSWLPPQCYDTIFISKDIIDIEEDDRYYEWYLDNNKTLPISDQDLPNSVISQDQSSRAWTQRSWQVEHCMYMFRVAAHTANRVADGEEKVWVDERAVDPDNALKCMRLITGQVGLSTPELSALEAVDFKLGRCKKIV